MSKFLLTAQLKLQAPNNTGQVISQMRRDLGSGIDVPVTVAGAKKSAKELDAVANSAKKATTAAQDMGRSFGLAFKRFAAFTVASRAVSLFTNTLAGAVDEAIQFQREMIKVSQVTGKSLKQLSALEKTITKLSTSLGVSSKELLGVSRILAQAGIRATQLNAALSALAKTTLAPTFEDIEKTAEGAVAIMSQFKTSAFQLEKQLGAINAVAGQFAVESGDLIGAVRRVGGVFVEAGGSLEELLGLFTSIRATTRESSESIQTGLRTILTRIQRPKTIEFMKQYGVELTNLEGKFVGPMEAVKRLNEALAGFEQGDIRFVEIAEELGGFRQIGKVIPLLKQYELAERARQAAVAGGDSLTKDAISAQAALATQISKVQQEFSKLIREITGTKSFQLLANSGLAFAKALIEIGSAIKPLLPLLAGLAAIKLFKGASGFASGIGSAMRGMQSLDPKRKNAGGRIYGFNRGGIVPGQGNRDTVPAMLTPGEFVIRKSSVQSIGADRLYSMNRYEHGGDVENPKPKQVGSGGGTAFAHISELTSRRQKAIQAVSKSLGGREIIKAYTNMGIDIPAKWNADWNKGFNAGYPPNFHGVFEKNLKKWAKSRNIFKTLQGRAKQKIYRLAEDDTENQELQKTLISSGLAIRKKFASKLSGNEFYDTDPQVYASDLGAKLIASVNEVQPELTKAIARTSAVSFEETAKDSGKTTKRRDSLGGVASSQKGRRKKNYKQIQSEFKKRVGRGDYLNLGGLVQAFADGGIVNASRIGAAILDPDEGVGNVTQRVGLDAVKKKIGGKGFDKTRGQKNLSQFYSGKNYTLVSQGLNKKTSEGFKDALLSGAAQGIGDATASLSADLGLGSASFMGDGKAQMASYLGSRAIGEIYEAGVNMLTNRGAFKDSPVSQPFDFPGGLTGGLSDNFNKLPASWVDAKSSYDAANAKGMFAKVADQIAAEYMQTDIYKGGVKNVKRAAKGGGISGQDTVPALLTPGEFVVNKASAKKIGYNNLNKMNKQGVVGFNAGGVVGVQKFSNGGAAEPGTQEFVDNLFKNADKTVKVEVESKSSRSKEASNDGLGGAGKLVVLTSVLQGLGSFAQSADGASTAFSRVTQFVTGFGTKLAVLSAVGEQLGVSQKKQLDTLKKGFTSEGRKQIAEGTSSKVEGFFNSISERVGRTKEQARIDKINERRQARGRAPVTRGGKQLRAVGALRGKAAAAIGKVGPLLGSAAGGLAKFVPIVGTAATAVSLVSGIANAVIGAQQQYESALLNFSKGTEGATLAQVENLAVLKEAPGLIQMFGQGASEAWVSFMSVFGGKTVDQLKLQAKAAALAAKFDREKAKNAREAAEALEDFKAGTISAANAGDFLTKNFNQATELGKTRRELASKTMEGKSTGDYKIFRNIFTIGGFLGESAQARNTRIDKEVDQLETSAKEVVEQEFQTLRQGLRTVSDSFVLSGKSFEQMIKEMGISIDTSTEEGKDQQQRLKKDFDARQKAIQQNIEYMKALNFGLKAFGDQLNASVVSTTNYVDAIMGSASSLERSMALIDQAATKGGVKIDDPAFASSLDQITSQAKALGADSGAVDRTAANVRASAFFRDPAVQAQLISAVQAGTATNTSIENQQKILQDTLRDMVRSQFAGNKEMIKAGDRLAAAIPKSVTDQNELIEMQKAGTLDKFFEGKFKEIGQASVDEFKNLAQTSIDKENQIVRLVERRLQLEQEMLNAAQESADLRIEADDTRESFGFRRRLDFGNRADVRTQSLNKLLELTNLDQISGSPASIERASAQTFGATRASMDQASFRAFAERTGRSGDDTKVTIAKEKSNRDKLNQANTALINYTKQRISLIREELDVIKKKNDIEKQNIDRLLSGDIEGFMQGQQAQSAAAALSTGDRSLAAGFSAADLQAGLKILADQGKSQVEIQRATQIAFEQLGLSRRQANIYSGSTPREMELRAEGGRFADTLDELGRSELQRAEFSVQQAQIDIANMEGFEADKAERVVLNAQEVTVPTAQVRQMQVQKLETKERDRALERADAIYKSRGEGGVGSRFVPKGPRFSRGGVVYANKGMFVPRGTDTVPAMLTPGEFVVNRQAVQQGNNLAMLTAMNSNAAGAGSGTGRRAMSRGGTVYANTGGLISRLFGGGSSSLLSTVNLLKDAFSKGTQNFNNAITKMGMIVDRLNNTQLSVALTTPQNINVTLGTSDFVAALRTELRQELFSAIKWEIANAQLDEAGNLVPSQIERTA